MSNNSRLTTKGNQPIDYSKLRGNLEKTNAVVAATLRNAVPTNGRNPQRNELNPSPNINPAKLTKLSNIISNNINAATDLREITPYIDKAELIWSTLLLYPNGQQERILNRDTENTNWKNASLHKELLTSWGNYFTNDYKIESMLRPMVNDVLWNTGSYCVLNLSRPALDNLINGSELKKSTGTEDFKSRFNSITGEHFTMVDGKLRTRNLGKYLRNPDSPVNKVDGLEAAFGFSPTITSEHEFNLFGKEDPDGVFNITMTDNPAILYLRKAKEVRSAQTARNVMGAEDFSTIINNVLGSSPQAENTPTKNKGPGRKPDAPKSKTANLNLAQLERLQNEVFPARNIGHEDIKFVRTQDGYSVSPFGRGISEHIPSTAVIPIHYNGNSESKLDYILLLDEEGGWLNPTIDAQYYQGIKKTNDSIETRNKVGSTNQLIASLKQVQQGKDCDFDMSEFADLARASIIKRFMSCVISDKVDSISVTLDEEVNKIFLSRMFKGQQVRCLYVPGDCISYVAVKYNRLGTGQSLTQSAKLHIARLAALDLADTLANLEAAQPHTLMTISPEREDDDPAHSIAVARAAYFEGNPRLHSILSTATLSVPQIVDTLKEQSLTVKVNAGDNPHIAAPEIDFSTLDKQNFKPVDDASRQETLNKIINYFALPRSWLDVADDGNNFQIEALTENQMVFNQAVNWGEKFAEGITDIERKHTMVNQYLMNELVRIINDNKKLWSPDSGMELPGKTDAEKIEVILSDFLSSIYCSLPRPANIETTNKLKDSLDAVNELVSKWSEMAGTQKTTEAVIKLLGIQAENFSAEEIQQSIKTHFLTRAFKRYNLPMPFDEIIDNGAGGGMASLVNDIVSQRNNVGDFIGKYVEEVAKGDKKIFTTHSKKVAKAIEALEKATGEAVEEEPVDDPDANPYTDDTPPENVDDDNIDDTGAVEKTEEELLNAEETELDDDEATKEDDANDLGNPYTV